MKLYLKHFCITQVVSFNCGTIFLCFTVENNVSLENVLVFFTGCDSIPSLGFSLKPSLEFITCSRFPVANTCENILRSSCRVHCFQIWHGFCHTQFTRIWKSMRGNTFEDLKSELCCFYAVAFIILCFSMIPNSAFTVN